MAREAANLFQVSDGGADYCNERRTSVFPLCRQERPGLLSTWPGVRCSLFPPDTIPIPDIPGRIPDCQFTTV
jgi:hypothetical protein